MATSTPKKKMGSLERKEEELRAQLAKLQEKKERVVVSSLEQNKDYKSLLSKEKELRRLIHHAKLRVTKKRSTVRSLIQEAWDIRKLRKQDMADVSQFQQRLADVLRQQEEMRKAKVQEVLQPSTPQPVMAGEGLPAINPSSTVLETKDRELALV